MALLGRCLTALCLLMFAVSSAAAESAGSAIGVDPEAGITADGALTTLVVGQDVFLGDRVQTSSGGRAELQFRDGTKLVVGPRSALVIEDYLLRDDGTAGNFAINALSGTFRFVTGDAAKDRYRITTPTGTMGVRGTEFDFVVDGRRATEVLMYSGATELCAASGECTVFADTCELAQMTSGAAVSLGLTNKLPRAERSKLRGMFLYGGSQQLLAGDFRLPQAAKCLTGSLSARDAAAASAKSAEARASTSSGSTSAPTAPGVDGAEPPPVDTPPPPPAPVPDDDGGDCAGHSGHNPGNSQNCS